MKLILRSLILFISGLGISYATEPVQSPGKKQKQLEKILPPHTEIKVVNKPATKLDKQLNLERHNEIVRRLILIYQSSNKQNELPKMTREKLISSNLEIKNINLEFQSFYKDLEKDSKSLN